MTKREAAVISAYTGYMCGSFDIMHEYIETILGRPVFTHELADAEVMKEIKRMSKPDFTAICEVAK